MGLLRNIPRELLTYIFKYLGPRYAKMEIIRWMTKDDIKCMFRRTSFESFVIDKNLTGCIVFLELYPKAKIDWCTVSRKYCLSETFISMYNRKLDWYWVSLRQTLSEKIIETFSDKVDWWNISMKQSMSVEFKKKYKDKIITRLQRV